MASPQDHQTPPSATLEPQRFQQFQTNDGAPPVFNSMVSSHSDPSVSSNPPSHVSTTMSSLFQADIDPGAIPVPVQLSIPPLQTDVTTMDVVPATSVDGSSSRTLLHDFPSQSNSFAVDHLSGGFEGLEASHQLASSPSATTTSTNVSHASSPAVSGMASSYSVTTNSLASALDSMVTPRSRSGSSASPPNCLSSSSDLGFPSGSSGPPTSAPESSFPYPHPYDNAASMTETALEQLPNSHLYVVGNMLKDIARTANSGRQACDMGSTTDAQQCVQALKKTVMLVSELIAALQVDDKNTLGFESTQHVIADSSYPSTSNPMDSGAMLDSTDGSRKRGAPSAVGDRVVKAMKLEPSDDTPSLPMLPSASVNVQGASLNGFPFAHLPSIPPPAISDIPPLSAPVTSAGLGSRPSSSTGIPHPLGLVSDANPHPLPLALNYPPVDGIHPGIHPTPQFSASAPASVASNSLPSTSFNPVLPNNGWGEGSVPVPRHQHTLSAGSSLVGIPESGFPVSRSAPLKFPSTPTYPSPTHATHLPHASHPAAASSSSISLPLHHPARSSRSSSFAHSQGEVHAPLSHLYDHVHQRPSTSSGPFDSRGSSPDLEDEMDVGRESDEEDGGDQTYGYQHSSPGSGQGEGSESKASSDITTAAVPGGTNGSSTGQRRMSRGSPSAEGTSAHGNEVPQEYRGEVERIFFEFLNNICSNLDATDAKGEPIHQTLMAKKMQRLDESPDFRPFKFRIQAFTNAFLEELARQGYPEEKIPMKKIRNFLWNQPYISRFNEDGKKSKSKGNHIWHVDAKKSDGGWVFRPFRRRLAGTPPGVAYVGLRWSWSPRIWDPQASRANMPVQYSSPSMPSWLSWKDDVLFGIPPPDAQSCDVTVEARFVQDGKEEFLSHTVHVTIAPVASVDSTFAPSRRPSLVGDLHNPRRVLSDSIVAQSAPPRILRTQSTIPPVPPVVAPDSQVVQVLTTAAQRVAQEAQSQVVASPNDVGPELQALAKQQHVLTVTAQAFNNKIIAGESQDGATSQSNALTAAAQQVVLQAARQVVADRTVAAVTSGLPAPQSVAASQVTVKDVSVATQSAVAQAVDMIGPLSSEVDVLITASSLLQQQTRAPLPPPSVMDPQLAAGDPGRPLTANLSHLNQYVVPAAVLPAPAVTYYTL